MPEKAIKSESLTERPVKGTNTDGGLANNRREGEQELTESANMDQSQRGNHLKEGEESEPTFGGRERGKEACGEGKA